MSKKDMNDYNIASVWFPSEYKLRCPHCGLSNWRGSPEEKFICHECGKMIENCTLIDDVNEAEYTFNEERKRWIRNNNNAGLAKRSKA